MRAFLKVDIGHTTTMPEPAAPTAVDIPATSADLSVECPLAIDCQNNSRPPSKPAVGRPLDPTAGRIPRRQLPCWGVPIATPQIKMLQPPVELALHASNEYVKRLEAAEMVISMSRPAKPWENAYCESFLGTLKREQISCSTYTTLEDLQIQISEFIDQFYNVQRLHSTMDYCSPEEFESRQNMLPPAALSFPRHEEIYPDA